MSGIGLLWDITQEQRICDLEEQVKELQEQMAMAARWIAHFQETQNEQANK
jgi:hypothetical protein